MSNRGRREILTATWTAAGLLASTYFIGKIGLQDAVRALTFFGVLTGALMSIAALLMLVGAAASWSYFTKQNRRERVSALQGSANDEHANLVVVERVHDVKASRVEKSATPLNADSGESDQLKPKSASILAACLLFGISAAIIADAMMLVVQLMGLGLTDFIYVWPVLTLWAFFALFFTITNYNALLDINAGFSLKLGLAAAGVVALANFAYTQIYVPNASATAETPVASVKFGNPVPRAGGGTVIPIHISLKNDGSSSLWVVNGLYEVDGEVIKPNAPGEDKYSEYEQSAKNSIPYRSYYHSESNELIEFGFPLYGASGLWLNPGQSYEDDEVAEVPKAAPYEDLQAAAYFTVARKDRVTIQTLNSKPPAISTGAPSWVTGNDATVESIRYDYSINPGTELLRETRPSENLYLWFVLGDQPYEKLTVAQSPEGTKEPTDKDGNSWISRYGLEYSQSNYAELPVSGLPGQ
ncbi:hypothetical protein KDK95_03990 [Actinospica sp. MGRD01-02]|uniref:Uncharacterized protein n=1 Tax=Actinospica acidithermotolerans TaxID=2828514 RepID=A0A941ECR1_9ACTN|nr:hypothetical protein [Actinospica acidithermotolerans]MBR7825454.1 hypothetical protein [Actinospica acidithermotolerans]